MPRLIWSPAALQDMSRLRRFLAEKNLPAAQRAVAAIRQGTKLLEQHPEAGRPIEDMPSGFREWQVTFGSAGYFVLYRVSGHDVVIVAVRHGREAGY